MNRRAPITFLLSALAALLVSAALAGAASASPAWHFNNVELTGSETTLSHATKSSFTFFGLTTTCNPFVYDMTISNKGGVGQGSITAMPLSNCSTDNAACSVEKISAGTLPWATQLKKVSASNYLVVEGVNVGIVYTGPECALSELLIPIKGSAGALIDNATETATFSSSSFKATGTALKTFGQPVEWNGVFTMAALGSGKGQALTVL